MSRKASIPLKFLMTTFIMIVLLFPLVSWAGNISAKSRQSSANFNDFVDSLAQTSYLEEGEKKIFILSMEEDSTIMSFSAGEKVPFLFPQRRGEFGALEYAPELIEGNPFDDDEVTVYRAYHSYPEKQCLGVDCVILCRKTVYHDTFVKIEEIPRPGVGTLTRNIYSREYICQDIIPKPLERDVSLNSNFFIHRSEDEPRQRQITITKNGEGISVHEG